MTNIRPVAADRLVYPWYPGAACDHIYENCPNYRRDPYLRDDWAPLGPLDPLGEDVCGMCAHRWKRKTGWAR